MFCTYICGLSQHRKRIDHLLNGLKLNLMLDGLNVALACDTFLLMANNILNDKLTHSSVYHGRD